MSRSAVQAGSPRPKVAVLAGDGIGPEVIAPCIEIMDLVISQAGGPRPEYTHLEAGAGLYQRTGDAFPDEVFEAARNADAILLGAMGDPAVRYPDGREITPQIDLRERLGLYAGVRPVRPVPGARIALADSRARTMDFVIVRESTEGLFSKRGKLPTAEDREASDLMRITRPVCERLFDFSFKLARERASEGRAPRVTCVDKANVLGSQAFFRQIFDERARGFSNVTADHCYVDAAAMRMVRQPWQFDVMVMENMFGDILSDLGAGLAGGMGMAPSADLGDNHGVFQPCHGTAPDIAGQGLANPTATILSGAMLLEWLAGRLAMESYRDAGRRIRKAVDDAFGSGGLISCELGGPDGTESIANAVRRELDGRRTALVGAAGRKLKGVIIGAGYFSHYQAEAWTRIPEVEIAAVADHTVPKAEEYASRHGISNSYGDYREMIEKEKPEFVDVVTPPDSHVEICRFIVATGAAIICQKPLAPDWEATQALAGVIRSGKSRFMVHENWRWQPWYREIKRLLNDGVLGEWHTLSTRMRLGDGWARDAYLARQPFFRDYPRLLVFETGVHFLDTFRFLGGEIDSVYARMRRLNPGIAGEDAAQIVCGFESGATAIFDGGRYNETEAEDPRFTFGTLRIDGMKGDLEMDLDGNFRIKPLGQPARDHPYPHPKRGFAGDCVHNLQRHFVDAMHGDKPFESELDDYLRTVALVEAAYLSAAAGRVVRLPKEGMDA
jgi:3-isopropylmalate dehydrogenase